MHASEGDNIMVKLTVSHRIDSYIEHDLTFEEKILAELAYRLCYPTGQHDTSLNHYSGASQSPAILCSPWPGHVHILVESEYYKIIVIDLS